MAVRPGDAQQEGNGNNVGFPLRVREMRERSDSPDCLALATRFLRVIAE